LLVKVQESGRIGGTGTAMVVLPVVAPKTAELVE
jgi:hypothetical protein